MSIIAKIAVLAFVPISTWMCMQGVPKEKEKSNLLVGITEKGGGPAGQVGYEAVMRSATKRQDILFGPVLSTTALRNLLLRQQLLNPSTSEWDVYTTKFTASFDIIDVGNVEDSLYCLGTNLRNGVLTHVIEHWAVVPESVPFGQPPEWNVNRDELYRNVNLGDIRLLEVDPEERFLLFVHDLNGVSKLSSMALVGNNPVTELYSEASLPTLPSITEVGRFQHQAEGRMWVFTDRRSRDFTILFDQTNDGIFESTLVLDHAGWQAAGFASGFIDDFVGP